MSTLWELSNNYFFWFLLLAGVIFIMWYIAGGQQHEFIGLKPFYSDTPMPFFVQRQMRNDQILKGHDLPLLYEEGDEIEQLSNSVTSTPSKENKRKTGRGRRNRRRHRLPSPRTRQQLLSGTITPRTPYTEVERKDISLSYESSPSREVSGPRPRNRHINARQTNRQDTHINTDGLNLAPQPGNELTEAISSLLQPLVQNSNQKDGGEQDDINDEDDIQVNNTPRVAPCYLNTFVDVKGLNANDPAKYESKGEKICRSVLEETFQVPFVNVRPNFLRNPETGRLLELDCYNEDLKLGLEYNGSQHYVYNAQSKFHKNYEEFISQVRRDMLKKELCDANDVYLITVPYNVAHDKIKNYIHDNLPNRLKHLIK